MYPKVLLIDATLHKKNATAITISNLFGMWPKENLFMIGTMEMTRLSNAEGYNNTFTLGTNDYYHRFPLGFLLRLFRTIAKKGNAEAYRRISQPDSELSINYTSNMSVSLDRLFTKLFQFLGLDHFFFRQIISNELREWISNSNPEYFYALLSTRHSILFAEKLQNEFNKPLIIHIMDDWPTTIGNISVFNKYWNKKINKEFKELLNLSFKRIAISKMMAEEYMYRYGGYWEYFHNPINLDQWLPYQKKIFSKHCEYLKIAYFGRIGRANEQAIFTFIDALNILNKKDFVHLRFDIYSSHKLPTSYSEHDFVKVYGFIDHKEIPKAIKDYDFLILPLSFNKKDVIFSRLSIPTKLSEYFISGVPVIVLAPEETAVSKFAIETNSAYVITTSVTTEIAARLNLFFSNEKMQIEVSKNARMAATDSFSISTIQLKYNDLFQ